MWASPSPTGSWEYGWTASTVCQSFSPLSTARQHGLRKLLETGVPEVIKSFSQTGQAKTNPSDIPIRPLTGCYGSSILDVKTQRAGAIDP